MLAFPYIFSPKESTTTPGRNIYKMARKPRQYENKTIGSIIVEPDIILLVNKSVVGLSGGKRIPSRKG